MNSNTVKTCVTLFVMLFNLNAIGATSMKIQSSAFKEGEEIPTKYTCEGQDISPPLTWEEVPDNAKSLVLIVDDPDAPDPNAPKMVWDHWVLYNIDPKSKELPEKVSSNDLPHGTMQGLTSWEKQTYGGPCPPIGRHRYYFHLYALDTELGDLHQPTTSKLREAMKNHIISQATLMGTYQKKK